MKPGQHLVVAGGGPKLQQLLEGGHLAAVCAAGHMQPVTVQGVPRGRLQVLSKHHLRQLPRARQRPLVLCHRPVRWVHCAATIAVHFLYSNYIGGDCKLQRPIVLSHRPVRRINCAAARQKDVLVTPVFVWPGDNLAFVLQKWYQRGLSFKSIDVKLPNKHHEAEVERTLANKVHAHHKDMGTERHTAVSAQMEVVKDSESRHNMLWNWSCKIITSSRCYP